MLSVTAGSSSPTTGSLRRVHALADFQGGTFRVRSSPPNNPTLRYEDGAPNAAENLAISNAGNGIVIRTTPDGRRAIHTLCVNNGGNMQIQFPFFAPVFGDILLNGALVLPEWDQIFEWIYELTAPGFNDTRANGYCGVILTPFNGGVGTFGSANNLPASDADSPNFVGITNNLNVWNLAIRQTEKGGGGTVDYFQPIAGIPVNQAFQLRVQLVQPKSGGVPFVTFFVNNVSVYKGFLGLGTLPANIGTGALNMNGQTADGWICNTFVNSTSLVQADLYVSDAQFLCGINDPSTP